MQTVPGERCVETEFVVWQNMFMIMVLPIRHIFLVETLGGIKYLDLTVEDGKVVLVRVDMGSPILTPAQIPVIADEAEAVAVPILVDETEYQMTCVSMGKSSCSHIYG